MQRPDLETLYAAIDALPPEDQRRLLYHLQARLNIAPAPMQHIQRRRELRLKRWRGRSDADVMALVRDVRV
ncbi:MAG: hypothetical protein ACLFTK_17060 [Anaerolineales bacterium]